LPLTEVTRIAYVVYKSYVFRAGNWKDDGNITSCNDHYGIIKVMVYCKARISLDSFLLCTRNEANKY